MERIPTLRSIQAAQALATVLWTRVLTVVTPLAVSLKLALRVSRFSRFSRFSRL